MTYQHDTNQINQPDALALARELEIKAKALVCPFGRHTAALRPQHARIAELEAMLDAVGAGGVGQSIKPQVQDDTAQKPVAWLVCSTNPDGSLKVEHAATWKEAAHEHINDAIVEYEVSEAGSWIVLPAYTAPQPTENLRCKSTQKRLATLWGYEKARQPLTKAQVLDLWEQTYVQRGTSGLEFARAVEAAHGIGGNHG